MLIRVLIFSGIGLLLVCFSLQAQMGVDEKEQTGAYITRAIGAKEGLPSSEIFSLIQDSRGMVWIGTSIGLSRFDGISFDNFLVCGGRQLGKTHRIREDTLHKVLWIMSDAGLCFFRHRSIHLPAGEFTVLDHNTGGGIAPDLKRTFFIPA